MPRVLVPLANGCEELEAVTIIDVLRRAGIEVISASLEDGDVLASRGVRLLADQTLNEVLDDVFDMIVLPGGGPGADALNADPRIRKLLQDMHQAGKYTAAICAAPKVLASAGLLDGRTATAYPGTLEAVALVNTQLSEDAVVKDGRVITSQGPGTAMDFSLSLIALLVGEDVRQQVENGLRPKNYSL